MAGIVGYGAYIPRLRLQKAAIAAANQWFNPGQRPPGGERAMANWDEDSITMGVEAARDLFAGLERKPRAVHFASTSFPFDDRQNAGILAAALDLEGATAALDVGGSQRAGASALLAALRTGADTLVVAADKRRAKASSAQELSYGDGAAAVLTGETGAIADLIAEHSETVDFVDHYRGHGADYDYGWEERWVREEGWLKLTPPAIKAALEKAGVAAADVSHAIVPSFLPRVGQQIAKTTGLREESLCDTLSARVGDAGVAHPLLMLANVLENAKAGETILLVAFGQGVDVLVLRTTPLLEEFQPAQGVSGWLARRREERAYTKYLAFNDTMALERGMRAEGDKGTALSALYRNRRTILSLIGGRCTRCGVQQFPKSNICVNPNCHALRSQEDFRFADLGGKVMSYTADQLTYSMDPPHHFGMVQFEGGGRMMADFTDVDQGAVAIGQKMRMVFRIKDFDAQRGFTRYFWKATPAAPTKEAA